MSESIKSVARNTEISRAVIPAIATALVGFASSANRAERFVDRHRNARGRGVRSKKSWSPVFARALNAALTDKRESAGAIDSIRSEDIAKFPDSNLAESHAARPRRVHHARRGRRPQHLGARPRLAVHARAHQRHGSDEHHRRHRQLGRHQPQPAVRLQRVRIGAVQQPHRAQDRVGRCRRRFAGRNRRPADRAAVRLQGIHHGRGPQGRLQRPAGRRASRAPLSSSATLSATATSACCSRRHTPSAACSRKARARCAGISARAAVDTTSLRRSPASRTAQLNNSFHAAHSSLWPPHA